MHVNPKASGGLATSATSLKSVVGANKKADNAACDIMRSRVSIEPIEGRPSGRFDETGKRDGVERRAGLEMKSDIQALRDLCRGYERASVIKAASVALGSVIADAEEREELASILATWFEDEEPAMAEPPPLLPSVMNAIRRELRARTQ